MCGPPHKNKTKNVHLMAPFKSFVCQDDPSKSADAQCGRLQFALCGNFKRLIQNKTLSIPFLFASHTQILSKSNNRQYLALQLIKHFFFFFNWKNSRLFFFLFWAKKLFEKVT